MRERPMLFSAPMVRAILAGRKTQTRRLVKAAQFPGKFHERCLAVGVAQTLREMYFEGRFDERPFPHGAVGDRLWVREAAIISPADWCAPGDATHRDADGRPRVVQYLATHPDREHANGYGLTRATPSIHMPRWASRLTLEITGVRVESLRDITEEDARAEGVEPLTPPHGCISPNQRMVTGERFGDAPHRAAFACLWDELAPRELDRWATNPWVWVIEFRRVEEVARG